MKKALMFGLVLVLLFTGTLLWSSAAEQEGPLSYEEYFSEEVYPHVPDAIWCYEFDPSKKESATNKEKQGAEFPFTRFFYEYKAPEAADDLLAQFMELEKSLAAKIAQL